MTLSLALFLEGGGEFVVSFPDPEAEVPHEELVKWC